MSAANRILLDLLASRTGQCVPESRRWRLETALVGVLREQGLGSVDALVARLTQPGEGALARQVVEALLNNETYFFRDRAMFDLLAKQVLPALAEQRARQRRLSIWSVGCSTGQETLSLAMLFAGQHARWADWTIDILGTDVSQSAIDTARQGRYSQFEIQRGLGMTEMIASFEEAGEGWQAKPRLRNMVRYEVGNLLDRRASARRFDLVLCRNVLLYFDAPNRARAFTRLADALTSDGLLMLGGGETVIGQTDRLVPARGIHGLYRPAELRAVSRFSPAQRATS